MAAPAIQTRTMTTRQASTATTGSGVRTASWTTRAALFALALLTAASPAIALTMILEGGTLRDGTDALRSLIASIPTVPEILAKIEALFLMRFHF